MRWDRTERLGAAFYVLLSAFLAWMTLTSSGTVWHFELARATDAAGQYLFFSGPILLALCALSAQRRAGLTRDLAPVLPQPQMGARAAWKPYAALGCAVHACVMAAAVVVALRNEAITVISYQPFVRQFVLIVALAAAGALLGPLAKSIALPGVVMILSLFVAVLLPFTGLRPFLLAGAGTFDFSFQRYSNALLVLGVLVAVGMLLPTVPWPWAPRSAAPVRMVGANVVLAAAVVIMVSGVAYPLVNLPEHGSCQIQSPKVCGPRHLDRGLMTVADVSQAVLRELPEAARPNLPRTLTLVAAARHSEDTGAVEFDTAMFGEPGSVARSVIATMSGQNSCSSDLPPKVLQSHVLGYATISGWLQRRLDVDQDGSYPSAMVAKLQSYPETDQDGIVVNVLEQVWSCGKVDLGPLK